MPFDHACFISYSRDEGKVMKRIMKDLEETLNGYLGIYIKDKKSYIDYQLQPGDAFDRKLLMAMCRSICMIVVYTPAYKDSAYCSKEFAAMEEIEKRRISSVKKEVNWDKSMIIPIIIRKGKQLPREIDCINYCDCSRMALTNFKTKEFHKKMEDIAKAIYDQHEKFKELGLDTCKICDSFEFPEGPIAKMEMGKINVSKKEPMNPYPKM